MVDYISVVLGTLRPCALSLCHRRRDFWAVRKIQGRQLNRLFCHVFIERRAGSDALGPKPLQRFLMGTSELASSCCAQQCIYVTQGRFGGLRLLSVRAPRSDMPDLWVPSLPSRNFLRTELTLPSMELRSVIVSNSSIPLWSSGASS